MDAAHAHTANTETQTENVSVWKTYLIIFVLMIVFCPRLETHTLPSEPLSNTSPLPPSKGESTVDKAINPSSVSRPPSTVKTHPYFEKYRHKAEAEQKRSGIPAAIILAQGFLESERGESELAKSGFNHFGVKCHKDWAGKRLYRTDDKPNECFRRYGSVAESFADHSRFLRQNGRYAALFELEATDYEAWAKGLKQAGYATDPLYAQKLMRIIRKYGL